MKNTKQNAQPERQDPWDALEHALDTEISALLVLQKALTEAKATDPSSPSRGVNVSRDRIADFKAEADFLQSLDGVEKLFAKADAACKIVMDNPDKYQIPTAVMQQRLGKVTQWRQLLHRPQSTGSKIKADQAKRNGMVGKTAEELARESHDLSNENYMKSQQELQRLEKTEQDAGLDRVIKIVDEIKTTAVNINEEVQLQDGMTAAVDRDMSGVQHKLAGLNQKVQTLLDNSSDKTKIIIIIVLMVILVLMIFILFS